LKKTSKEHKVNSAKRKKVFQAELSETSGNWDLIQFSKMVRKHRLLENIGRLDL